MRTLFIIDLINELIKSGEFQALLGGYRRGEFPLKVEGAEGAFRHLLTAGLFGLQESPALMVFPRNRELRESLLDFQAAEIPLGILPDWDIIPYSGQRGPLFKAGERLQTLTRLLTGEKLLVLASLRTFLSPVVNPEWLREKLFAIRPGQELDPAAIGDRLSRYGYLRVPLVQGPGEFALRGEVLDLFAPGAPEAVRVVFEFDRVEEIKTFGPESQASREKIQEIYLSPCREILWEEPRIRGLEAFLKGRGVKGGESLIDALWETGSCPHEEFLFPLSFERPSFLADYLGRDSLVFFAGWERLTSQGESLRREYRDLYYRSAGNLPKPEFLLREPEEGLELPRRGVRFYEIRGGGSFGFTVEGPRSFFGNITYLKEELVRLEKAGYRVGIFAESESQALRIRTLLKDFTLEVAAPAEDSPGCLSGGFNLPLLRIMVIQENEIFGRKRRAPPSLKKAKTELIDTFVELNPGDYVVHINYGIGLFQGIDRITTSKTERDYIKLSYADEETLFIPIEQVNLIQRYIGSEGRPPALDRIGGRSWEKRKEKVRRSVEELAEKLIKLYSRRREMRGFAFPGDTDWQVEFEAAFPYEETPDQLTCIAEVKADMEAPKPMDRLICGDVGYGKTEIAMRAAFKAVMGGRQAAFLAPTTILTEQHAENFKERFDKFPVKIGMLSRFVPPGEQKRILELTAAGEIDILIGTHRLLQEDVKFKNLGLIIIDEEQRFGVKHKEKLKVMKNSVDCLTLSATPIPRTLHMSLLKIRDMSLLTTPPQNRLPIETVIKEFDPSLVALAIRREIARGGQVFYLHNRVETLEATRLLLSSLVPEALIESVHGQMDSRDMEDIMYRFVHGAFQILAATTIIENGIDIPNVNTIIIDRADMYGISQLYQLRGRVGRSDRKAYAYLFYPDRRVLSELAAKRLEIISDFTELGAGFKVALKDLEVRGAGNLLGREQSGDVMAVGFDMYLRLLEKAIRDGLGEEEDSGPEVYIELVYSGFIPGSYISGTVEKMEIYKKIAAVETAEELGRVAGELDDRFGPMPDEVLSLLSLAEIRILCRALRIASLREKNGAVEVEFSQVSLLNVEKVMRLIRDGAGSVLLDSKRPEFMLLKTSSIGLKEKSEFIRDRLKRLL